MDYSDIEQAFEVVNNARAKEAEASGFPIPTVTDDEKLEARRWADGNELKLVIDTPGFEILFNKLEKYATEYIQDLVAGTDPSDTVKILQRHALAHAAQAIRERLIADVRADLLAAENSPEIIKQGIRAARQSATRS